MNLNEPQKPQLNIGAVSSRSILESDKRIVYEMGTTSTSYTIMSAYEYGTIHDFGEKAGIINTLNYMSVINRLRKALESLWFEGKCERFKYGRGYSYNFTKSLGNGY
jgi:hypothetical protein